MPVSEREYMRERKRRSLWRWPVVIGLVAMLAAGTIVILGRTEMLNPHRHPGRAIPSESTDLRSTQIDVVNVNTAWKQQIEAIPYVSPAIAERIMADRPYASVDDLIRVRGIGPKTLERIRPYVRVSD